MFWIFNRRILRQVIVSVLLFLAISTVPASINYISWLNDIEREEGTDHYLEQKITDNSTFLIEIGQLPLSTEIFLIANRSSSILNTTLKLSILPNSSVNDFFDGSLSENVLDRFAQMDPGEVETNYTVITAQAENYYLIIFSVEPPIATMNITIVYQLDVEPYLIRKGFFILIVYCFSWLIAYSSIPSIKRYRRQKRLADKTRRERELEEKAIFKKYRE